MDVKEILEGRFITLYIVTNITVASPREVLFYRGGLGDSAFSFITGTR